MEVVLNFSKKEMVIKEAANINELYDRLKKMLGKDLKEWTIVSDVVYRDNSWWYYKPYQTYPWYEWTSIPGTLTSTDGTTAEITSGTYCLSDNCSESLV